MDNVKSSGICTNTDTGLLKTVACVTMLIDHIGYVFFPDYIFLRIIGRIAFPIFAYCLVIGFIYTKNVKKYAVRLLLFAVISQPFYTLLFFPDFVSGIAEPENLFSFQFWAENIQLNVGFTLLLGLFALYGIKYRKYIYTAFAILLALFFNFEYGIYCIALIILMYLSIGTTKEIFGLAAGIYMFLDFFIGGTLEIFGISLNPQGFAILALPFMLFETNSNIKIPRLINYGFYPLHIAAMYFIKLWLQ